MNPTGDFVEVLGDAGGIGKQAVDGDEGGNRGKAREQAVVGHAGRERENAVLTDVAVDAPSSCRDLGGGAGVPSAIFTLGRHLGGRGMSVGFSVFRERFVLFRLGEPVGRDDAIPQKSDSHQTSAARLHPVPSARRAPIFPGSAVTSSANFNLTAEVGFLLKGSIGLAAISAAAKSGRRDLQSASRARSRHRSARLWF
ncbi:hypothetical protein HAP54_000018350 [Bradyrhizobium sp. 2S1]|nr:hypothetical protein [Bradyrhizobium sp. 2S1]